jgi:hypothetical protein
MARSTEVDRPGDHRVGGLASTRPDLRWEALIEIN